MGNVRRDVLGPPHGTIQAAVIENKNTPNIHKSSECINEKKLGPYRGVGYLSLVTLKIWQNRANEKYCNFATSNKIVDTKTIFFQTEPNI